MLRASPPHRATPEVDIANDQTPGRDHEQLYPAWSTGVFRLALAAALVALLSVPAALWAWERSPYVSGVGIERQQPVLFDHRHHVRDDGIDCIYCHKDALRSASAGMPASSLCMGCHAQIWTNSPLLAPVRRAYFEDAPLSWNRVTLLPKFVFFDHSIHVNKGVGCVTCHGRVDQMAELYAVEPFTMQFCLDCHRAPDARLRPLSEITNMTWQPSAAAGSGAQLRRRWGAEPPTDCSTCHR